MAKSIQWNLVWALASAFVLFGTLKLDAKPQVQLNQSVPTPYICGDCPYGSQRQRVDTTAYCGQCVTNGNGQCGNGGPCVTTNGNNQCGYGVQCQQLQIQQPICTQPQCQIQPIPIATIRPIILPTQPYIYPSQPQIQCPRCPQEEECPDCPRQEHCSECPMCQSCPDCNQKFCPDCLQKPCSDCPACPSCPDCHQEFCPDCPKCSICPDCIQTSCPNCPACPTMSVIQPCPECPVPSCPQCPTMSAILPCPQCPAPICPMCTAPDCSECPTPFCPQCPAPFCPNCPTPTCPQCPGYPAQPIQYQPQPIVYQPQPIVYQPQPIQYQPQPIYNTITAPAPCTIASGCAPSYQYAQPPRVSCPTANCPYQAPCPAGTNCPYPYQSDQMQPDQAHDDPFPKGYPSVTVEPEVASVKLGAQVNITCKADGESPLKVFWQRGRNESEATTLPKHLEVTQGKLIFPSIHKNDQGYYHCVAVNKLGKAMAMVTIKVEVGPKSKKVTFSTDDDEEMQGDQASAYCGNCPYGSQRQRRDTNGYCGQCGNNGNNQCGYGGQCQQQQQPICNQPQCQILPGPIATIGPVITLPYFPGPQPTCPVCPPRRRCQDCSQPRPCPNCPRCPNCPTCVQKPCPECLQRPCPNCPKCPSCPNCVQRPCRECSRCPSCPKCVQGSCPDCPRCPIMPIIPACPRCPSPNCPNCPRLPLVPSCPQCPSINCPKCPSITCPNCPAVSCPKCPAPTCPQCPAPYCPPCPAPPPIQPTRRPEPIETLPPIQIIQPTYTPVIIPAPCTAPSCGQAPPCLTANCPYPTNPCPIGTNCPYPTNPCPTGTNCPYPLNLNQMQRDQADEPVNITIVPAYDPKDVPPTEESPSIWISQSSSSGNIVLQCKTTSPDAKLSWARILEGEMTDLPKGSLVDPDNGTLTLFNVTPEDYGTFACKAARSQAFATVGFSP